MIAGLLDSGVRMHYSEPEFNCTGGEMDSLSTTKQKSILKGLSLLLRNVDAPTSYISELSNSLQFYELAQSKTFKSGLQLVCTGVYNAGKSSLLNALLEKEIFEVGNIPTTKYALRYSFNSVVFTDTPGLNATVSDDDTTESIYRDMDLMLFVSNIQNGGLTESEAKWLKKIVTYFGSPKRLSDRTIFVLTNCFSDNYDDGKVANKYRSDIRKIVGVNNISLMCVDSAVWRQGFYSKDLDLINESKIGQLRALLDSRIAEIKDIKDSDSVSDKTNARGTFLESCMSIESFCREKMDSRHLEEVKASKYELINIAVEKIATRMKKEFSFCEADPDLRCPGLYNSDTKSSTESEALKKARDKLYSFYSSCHQKYSTLADNMSRKAKKIYGSTGSDSAYYLIANSVNSELEELFVLLKSDGYPVSKFEKIECDVDTSMVLDFIEMDMKHYREYTPSYENYRNLRLDISENWEGTKNGFGGLFSRDIYSYYASNLYYLCSDMLSDFRKEKFDLYKSLISSINSTFDGFKNKVQNKVTAITLCMKEEISNEIERRYKVGIKPYEEIIELISALKGGCDGK